MFCPIKVGQPTKGGAPGPTVHSAPFEGEQEINIIDRFNRSFSSSVGLDWGN